MQCRFCLESDYTLDNPLTSPCVCRGSVGYVHALCLRRWVFAGDVVNTERLLCSICKTPFRIFLPFERVPGQDHISNFFLWNTLLGTIIIQYFYLIAHVGTRRQLFEILWEAEMVVHSVYMVHFLLNWRVRNLMLYARMALARRTLLWNCALHVYTGYVFVHGKNVFSMVLMHIVLGRYWREHAGILEDINARLLTLYDQ